MLLLFVVLHSRTLSSLHHCTTRNSSVVLLADPLHTLLDQHGSIINVIPCFSDKTMCYFSSPCTALPHGCSSPACRGCQTCPRVTRRHQQPLTSPRPALMYEQGPIRGEFILYVMTRGFSCLSALSRRAGYRGNGRLAAASNISRRLIDVLWSEFPAKATCLSNALQFSALLASWL